MALEFLRLVGYPHRKDVFHCLAILAFPVLKNWLFGLVLW